MIPALLASMLAAVTVEPKLLVLGEEPARATVTIESAHEPRLSASAGRLENLRKDGDLWRADYVPPEETIPRVAILAALDGDELSWTALPLWGQGDAVVQTKPHARISVDIGPKVFGPVEADASGEAVVPVVVPPGVREARQKGRAIDLHVPPMPLLQLVILPREVRADATQEVPVRVLAVDSEGTPRSAAELVFTASRGSVSSPRMHAPGELWATWSLPPGVAQPEHLSVALAEVPKLTAEGAVSLVPGPAAVLSLTADRPALTAGETEPLRVNVVAHDAAGNLSPEPLVVDQALPPDAAPALQPQSQPQTQPVPQGQAFLVRAPGRFSGPLVVTAHPRGRQEPRATLPIALQPAAPAAVVLDPQAARVMIGSRLQLHARRTDRFGNVIASQPPQASAPQGSVAQLSPEADGAWLATWVPPPAWRSEDAFVEVRFGEQSARSSISILPRDGLFALSPKLGGISNFAHLHAPLVALEAALRTDRLGPELSFSLEGSWAYQGRTDAVQAVPLRARDNELALSSQVSLRQHVSVSAVAYAGAGPTLSLVTSRLYVGSDPGFSETGLVPGVLLSAGAELRFAGAVPFVEARYSWRADPGFTALHGTLSAVSLLFGSRFELL